MIKKGNYIFQSSGKSYTSRQRREEMLETLAGCTIRKKKNHPFRFRKMSTFISGEWKNRGNHYKMCLKKDRYRSESEANAMISRIHRYRPEAKLRSYYCSYCNGWHLTHK